MPLETKQSKQTPIQYGQPTMQNLKLEKNIPATGLRVG